MAQRADYLDAIPLCPNHHQNGGYGVALHAGQGKFESRFGTEIELLKHTKRLIGIES